MTEQSAGLGQHTHTPEKEMRSFWPDADGGFLKGKDDDASKV